MDSSDLEPIIIICISVLMILVTLIGNIFVIMSVFTYRPLRVVQNFFMVSLAVADLTVVVMVVPLSIAYYVLDKWMFGMAICKLWATCDILCCTASILNITAIALDRYWAITDPLKYEFQRTLKRVLWMIALTWIISVMISILPLLDISELTNNGNECELSTNKHFVIFSASLSFYIPLIIMIIVYFKIYRAIKQLLAGKVKKARENMKPTEEHASVDPNLENSNDNDVENPSTFELKSFDDESCKDIKEYKQKMLDKTPKKSILRKISATNGASPKSNAVDNLPDVFSDENKPSDSSSGTSTGKPSTSISFIKKKRRISLRKERRAAFILGIVMGVFIICWLPFFVMYVSVPFSNNPVSKRTKYLITWLGYINSALNPIIYTVFNTEFRGAFRITFSRCL